MEHGTDGRVTGIPGIGFSGDWFVHTGDMTVFGVVAVPTWITQVYLEVGQFVATWVPLLELWSLRLNKAIRNAHDYAASASARELRALDQEVRRQASELRSAQLCQSHLHRKFLDTLLIECGVTGLEQELDVQIEAAERLSDWYDEQWHRDAESARNILLLLIGVFGVFGLAGYLSLANGSSEGRYKGFFRFLTDNPGTEVQVLLAFFLVFLGSGLILLFWNRLRSYRVRRARRRPRGGQKTGIR